MSIIKFCDVFQALSCEIRLRVFDFILQAGDTGTTPKEIVKKFGVDGGTLNFHLKKLEKVNLITTKGFAKRGRYRFARDLPVFLRDFSLSSDPV